MWKTRYNSSVTLLQKVLLERKFRNIRENDVNSQRFDEFGLKDTQKVKSRSQLELLAFMRPFECHETGNTFVTVKLS